MRFLSLALLSSVSFCFTYFTYVNGQDGKDKQAEVIVRFENFYACKDMPKGSVEITDIVTRNYNRSTVALNGTLILHEEISDELRMDITYVTCVNKKQANTCQTFRNLYEEDVCEDLKDPKSLPYRLLKSIVDFPGKCPLKPGAYKIVNGVSGEYLFGQESYHEGYWKITIASYDGIKYLGCFTVEITVLTK